MNPNNTLNTNKMFKIARNNNLLLSFNPIFTDLNTKNIKKQLFHCNNNRFINLV